MDGEKRRKIHREERGCSVAADQMIHDKLAQRTDLWGHPGRYNGEQWDDKMRWSRTKRKRKENLFRRERWEDYQRGRNF